jgi:ricin-type beta-trefoil lectin protein/putative Ig domain-containing protein
MRAVPALRRAGVTIALVAALAVPGLSPLSAGATVTASTASARAASASTPASTAAGVTVYRPDTQKDPVGSAITSLQVIARDSNAGAVLTFSASGLPLGLTISPSGLISGTPSTGGQYSVTVTATDQNGASGSAAFTWDAYGTITLTAPAETTVSVGFPVSLQVQATDSVPGQTLTFHQAPNDLRGAVTAPGLSVSASGLITGSILRSSLPGWFMLWVSATDGLGAVGEYLLQFQALLEPGPTGSGPMKSAVAGKCLDDTGSGTADNNPVQLYSCNGDAAQQWQVDGDEIRDFGKCLSDLNGGTANGTRVVLYSCQPSNYAIAASQDWFAQPDGVLFNANGGCLDDPNASRANGVKLQIWGCDGRVQQNWTLPTGPMTSAIPRMCADESDASAANGAKVQLWTCNGQKSQQWTAMLDGTIRIQGKCLDVVNHGTANGSKVQLWSCTSAANQLWFTLPDGQIVNDGSGRCLDDPSASSKDGTQLQIWDCNGLIQQSWRVP